MFTHATLASEPSEVVSFHHRPELPGVQLRRVERSSSRWRCFATGFEFFVPETWRGEAVYRRMRAPLGPEHMLCMHPGEIFFTRQVFASGSGSALTIDAELFYEHLADHVAAPRRARIPWLVTPSRALAWRHADLARAMLTGEATALDLHDRLQAFVATVAVELLGVLPLGPADACRGRSLAARVHERLCGEEIGRIDFDRLAGEFGVTRFRLLRVFKREYGLPPRDYELRFRIGRAQLALAAGNAPAEVAAQCGFADQSHLSSHFRRLVGVTPARYARAMRRGP